MTTAAPVTFRFVGGALIGFDLSDRTLERLTGRLDFAAPLPSNATPTLCYRSVRGRDGSERFERHDTQRTRPIERIGTTVDDLIDDLHLSIALHAPDDVFVHAGVVAWRGRAIVLPGRSHAGKSTLVHALVSAGAVYYSDEYARIMSNGDIAAYPRPIQLRTPTGRRIVDPRAIGDVADGPIGAALVVFTHYRTGAVFEPTTVSPAQAALELFDNTVVAEIAPGRAAQAVASVARCAATVRSDRAEADIAASNILGVIDSMVVAS